MEVREYINKNGYDSKTPAAKSASPIDDFFSAYGVWEDDRDTDTIIADIQNSRMN
ncbi:hypothetical protein FACS1894137_15140 [Spirochaetia bacterium]|nr:hypothetical protein FACS1894137_15140 [Spirochaetia bacterium]